MLKSIVILMGVTAFLVGAGKTQPSTEQSRADASELAQAQEQVAMAEDDYKRAHSEERQAAAQLADLRAVTAEASGRIDASSDGIRKAIQWLEEQQEQLQLEEAGANGRRQGLAEAVEKYTKLAKERGEADPVVAELEKVVQLHEEELQRLQAAFKAATVSASDLSAAQMALAQSRAELAAAKRTASGGAGSNDALDAWNREAMNLSIEELGRQAQLQYLDGRLKQLKAVVPNLAALDEAAAGFSSAQAAEAAAKATLTQEQAALFMIQRRVEIQRRPGQ